MQFSELEGKRVAVWGHGREGRAALRALRTHLPNQPITVFCSAAEVVDVDPAHAAMPIEPDADALAAFDFVIKSPGISAYKPEIAEAKARGAQFTSGTALWFGENPQARVVGITGTKGKSTTSAILAHLARSLGIRTALTGNIGMPLLELDGEHADFWVIELSSFQTGETGPIELGVITSLYQEHLDWHGSPERYVTDKLKLADAARTLLVNATQPSLLQSTEAHAQRVRFGDSSGWHIANAGQSMQPAALDETFICRRGMAVLAVSELPTPGAHNALNACAALAALEIMGYDAIVAAPALASFQPLPHRLQTLGTHGGKTWINDSIATTPAATLAALQSLPASRVALIVGGYERGVDWEPAAHAIAELSVAAILTQGANGERIANALRACGSNAEIIPCANLETAVDAARNLSVDSVLLSPGAPSFDQFHDYTERGRRFSQLAGFDSSKITAIAGLGIA